MRSKTKLSYCFFSKKKAYFLFAKKKAYFLFSQKKKSYFFFFHSFRKKKYGIFTHLLDFGVNFDKNNLVPRGKKIRPFCCSSTLFGERKNQKNICLEKKEQNVFSALSMIGGYFDFLRVGYLEKKLDKI
jgi:hypothetical protein